MNNLLEKLKGSLPGDQSGWETASQRKQWRQTFFLVIFKHLLSSWKWWHDTHFGTAAVSWSWWCLWFPSALLLLWEYCKQEQVPLLPSLHLPGGICVAAPASPAFISQGWPSPALLTSSSQRLWYHLLPTMEGRWPYTKEKFHITVIFQHPGDSKTGLPEYPSRTNCELRESLCFTALSSTP